MPSGFSYVPDFIGAEQQSQLIDFLRQSDAWENQYRRKILHFGYDYTYVHGQVTKQTFLGPLPPLVETLVDKIMSDGLSVGRPNMCLVCMYLEGEGVGMHIDRADLFGDTVLSLSLGRSEILTMSPIPLLPSSGFTGNDPVTSKITFPVAPGSIYALSGPARYSWKHGIKSKKSVLKKRYGHLERHQDYVITPKDETTARYALTFREVLDQ